MILALETWLCEGKMSVRCSGWREAEEVGNKNEGEGERKRGRDEKKEKKDPTRRPGWSQ